MKPRDLLSLLGAASMVGAQITIPWPKGSREEGWQSIPEPESFTLERRELWPGKDLTVVGFLPGEADAALSLNCAFY